MNSWVIETLVSSTALMLLVLAIRRPVARLLGARTAYALWALPALRLLLPPLPGWTTLYAPVAPHEPAAPLASADTAIATALPAVTTSPAIVTGIDMGLMLPLLIALWAVGAAAWFGWQMWRYRRFMAEALATAESLASAGGVEVLVTPAVAGPMAAGIRHRRILLPADFTSRYTADERRLALLHEGAHHDRGDLLANLAGLAVVAAHWWNPVAHLAYRAFRRDQELACDATVLAGSTVDTRVAYGRAVIKSACSRTPAAACAMNHKSHLKQRIAMMKSSHDGAARAVSGGLFAVVAIAGGLLLSASGSAYGPDDMPPVTPMPPTAPEAPLSPVAAMPAVAPVAPLPAVAPVAPPAPPAAVARRSQHIVIHRSDLSAADRRELRNAEREARRAGVEARRAGEAAGRAGREAGRQAEAAVRAMDIEGTVRHALAAARIGMVSHCAAAGVTVTRDIDPTTCDAQFRRHIRETVRQSLQAARMSIYASHGLAEEARREALQGIDEAIAESDREPVAPIG
ncbi:M56 family metallopeptidase [Sandarakinorhabdus sp. DWP1-3-1]|uniref:M56 family metallopeptidase n=1 Tax=Sandarakinorhabdus sp. DWP1-3-1 TaxID=2804627 RepID=UPI003CE72CB8